VEADGPRTVVFRVSGIIPLEKDLEIENPNVTIAGQTAPGDGICLKNYKIGIRAKDVVVRFIRIRRGAESKQQDDGLGLYAGKNGDAENVIVDHCSVSWTCDESVNTWHGTKNATIQWCIISEALHNAVHVGHGFAATLGGVNTSYHHNLIANCPGRNPSIAGNNDFQTINLDFRDNVVFNWQERVIDGKPTSINFVGNYYKHGPSSRFNDHIASIDSPNYKKVGTPKWYIAGNFLEDQPEISADNRKGVKGEVQYLVDKPTEFIPIKEDGPKELFEKVLAGAGATLPKRDPVDTRIVDETRTGKTHFGDGVVQDPKDVGGWPKYESKEAAMDSDHDGIPDWWEKKYGLNPNDPSDANKDMNGDGYTNLEKYLNGLDPTKKVDWRKAENNVDQLRPGALDEPK
jgi:pectate lyase